MCNLVNSTSLITNYIVNSLCVIRSSIQLSTVSYCLEGSATSVKKMVLKACKYCNIMDCDLKQGCIYNGASVLAKIKSSSLL